MNHLSTIIYNGLSKPLYTTMNHRTIKSI